MLLASTHRCAHGLSVRAQRRSAVAVVRAPAAYRAADARQWRAKAAQDDAAVETEVVSEPANGAAPQSLFEVAREALAADPIDTQQLGDTLSALEQDMVALQERLASAESAAAASDTKAGASQDQLLRLQADFENFRKRTAGEKEELASRAKGDLVTALLPVLDNFELARTQVKGETEGEQKIINSYQALYKQFADTLKGLGVEAVPTVGAPFDPALHDAIMREASDEVPDGTVLMEFRKGFQMGERLLRPAMVKVSFNDEQEAETPAAETRSSTEEQ